MKRLNKNTWLIYYVLISIGALLLMVNVNSKYDELLSKKQHEQLYITKIVAADISTLLAKHEVMIDLISENFIKNQKLNQSLARRILQKSDLLIGFFIFDNEGKLKEKTANLPDKNYDLKPEARFYSRFKKVLQQDSIMLSRPLYSSNLRKWIIPLKKRLRDKDDNIIGVMMSAIDLKKLEQKWSKSKAFGNNVELTLDKSFYQLMHTGMHIEDFQKNYNNPLTSRQIESTKVQLKKLDLTLETLRKTEAVAQIVVSIGTRKVLHSIMYNKEYKFWTHSSRPLNDLTTPILYSISYYILLYLIIVTITFYLFRWIVQTEESKLIALTYKTEHDDLTACYNRTMLTQLVLTLKNNHKDFSLLYIDLDNFKNINDSFGHQYGDILLQEVSRRIQKSLEYLPGYLVRYSGDEFILLLETNNKKIVRNFTTTLLKELAKFHSINNNSFSVTSSVGITRYPDDTQSLDTLISYAENSMMIAKKVKNQYLFFSQEVHQQLIKKTKIEQALHLAIDANEISIVYQPQLDNQQHLYGVEALVRWNSKELGHIPPDVFIPIAEETDLMPKLGLYIMNKAMSEISELQKQLDFHFALSINVSVRQFVQVNFFELLMKSINEFGTKDLPITLEITESLFIESIDVLQPIFLKMKKNNVSLALDDFGTGYSSLSMLREVPIDELKIDKSFVDHITDNKTDQAMVKSIISMGKNLDMRVLAEGVETIEQATILKQSGCDLFQGYYFSRPLKINELAAFAK